ncbi:MAG: peptidoglycan editing factor PgeF, partial [Eubacteriales bacterium]
MSDIVIKAGNIAAAHGFTTRRGGVSEGMFSSMNLALHRGDSKENVRKNFEILARELDFDLKNAVLTRQTHSDIVRAVTRADARGIDCRDYPECDALVSTDRGTALVIFTADCTPILFHDPVTGAVGAAHAGWRGTAADIAGKTVRVMCKEFGCRAQDIRAAIGPNIGACCFETDGDVPRAVLAEFGREAEGMIFKDGGKYRVDLKAVNALALRRAGVENIEVSRFCTMCH